MTTLSRPPIRIKNIASLFVLDVIEGGGAPNPWDNPPQGGEVISLGAVDGSNDHMISWTGVDGREYEVIALTGRGV